MKFENFGKIDRAKVPAAIQRGGSGVSTARIVDLGDVTLRLVAYSAEFKSDHWCTKGHILYVIAGNVVIEYADGTHTDLSAGMSWHAPDGASTAHFLRCEREAAVFIVD